MQYLWITNIQFQRSFFTVRHVQIVSENFIFQYLSCEWCKFTSEDMPVYWLIILFLYVFCEFCLYISLDTSFPDMPSLPICCECCRFPELGGPSVAGEPWAAGPVVGAAVGGGERGQVRRRSDEGDAAGTLRRGRLRRLPPRPPTQPRSLKTPRFYLLLAVFSSYWFTSKFYRPIIFVSGLRLKSCFWKWKVLDLQRLFRLSLQTPASPVPLLSFVFVMED